MPETKSPATFSIGDAIRVKPGVTDPDFPAISLGGWAGTISEVKDGDPRTYPLSFNERTLKSIPPIYYKRCERLGFVAEEIWLSEEDLEPDSGAPVPIEQPTGIVAEPLSMADQDDRIRAIFGLTSDDPLPEADGESLLSHYKYLAAEMSFPFEAKYSFETEQFQSKTHPITILGLVNPDDFSGDEYGLFCQARRSRELIELPLTELEVRKGNSNRRLVKDYSYWFVNG